MVRTFREADAMHDSGTPTEKTSLVINERKPVIEKGGRHKLQNTTEEGTLLASIHAEGNKSPPERVQPKSMRTPHSKPEFVHRRSLVNEDEDKNSSFGGTDTRKNGHNAAGPLSSGSAQHRYFSPKPPIMKYSQADIRNTYQPQESSSDSNNSSVKRRRRKSVVVAGDTLEDEDMCGDVSFCETTSFSSASIRNMTQVRMVTGGNNTSHHMVCHNTSGLGKLKHSDESTFEDEVPSNPSNNDPQSASVCSSGISTTGIQRGNACNAHQYLLQHQTSGVVKFRRDMSRDVSSEDNNNNDVFDASGIAASSQKSKILSVTPTQFGDNNNKVNILPYFTRRRKSSQEQHPNSRSLDNHMTQDTNYDSNIPLSRRKSIDCSYGVDDRREIINLINNNQSEFSEPHMETEWGAGVNCANPHSESSEGTGVSIPRVLSGAGGINTTANVYTDVYTPHHPESSIFDTRTVVSVGEEYVDSYGHRGSPTQVSTSVSWKKLLQRMSESSRWLFDRSNRRRSYMPVESRYADSDFQNSGMHTSGLSTNNGGDEIGNSPLVVVYGNAGQSSGVPYNDRGRNERSVAISNSGGIHTGGIHTSVAAATTYGVHCNDMHSSDESDGDDPTLTQNSQPSNIDSVVIQDTAGIIHDERERLQGIQRETLSSQGSSSTYSDDGNTLSSRVTSWINRTFFRQMRQFSAVPTEPEPVLSPPNPPSLVAPTNSESAGSGIIPVDIEESMDTDSETTNRYYSLFLGIRAWLEKAFETIHRLYNRLFSNAGEDSNPDDDPICQQLLIITGILGFWPIMFIIGSVLYFLTPKEFTISRRWGLVNIFLLGFCASWAIGTFASTPPPLVEKVVIYRPSRR